MTASYGSQTSFQVFKDYDDQHHLRQMIYISGYKGMFQDFFEAIRTGREPVMTLARAQQGMEIVETAYGTAAGTHTPEAVR